MSQPELFENLDINCPVCLGEFEDPCFVCPNHHTLCRRCLQNLNIHSTLCPICRQKTITPRENTLMKSFVSLNRKGLLAKPIECQATQELKIIKERSLRVFLKVKYDKERIVKAHSTIDKEIDCVIRELERRRKIAHEKLSLAEPPLKRLFADAKTLSDALATGDTGAARNSLARLTDTLEQNDRLNLFREVKVPKLLTIQ